MRHEISRDLRDALLNIFTPYHLSAPCPLVDQDLVTAAFTPEELEARRVLNQRHRTILKRTQSIDFQLSGYENTKFTSPIRFELEHMTSFPEVWFTRASGTGQFPTSHPKNDEAMAWMVKTERINKELFLMTNLAEDLSNECANMLQLAKLWPDLEPWLRKLPWGRSMLGTQLGYLQEASSKNIRNTRAPALNVKQARIITAAKPVLAKIHLLSSNPDDIKVRRNQKVVVGQW